MRREFNLGESAGLRGSFRRDARHADRTDPKGQQDEQDCSGLKLPPMCLGQRLPLPTSEVVGRSAGGFGCEGAFSSESVILRHGGIYENLSKGLVQVYDGRNYAEWVEKGQENGRRVIDNSKSVEMVHTGRVSMREYARLAQKD